MSSEGIHDPRKALADSQKTAEMWRQTCGALERELAEARQRERGLQEAVEKYKDLWIAAHEEYEPPPPVDLLIALGHARGELFAALTPPGSGEKG